MLGICLDIGPHVILETPEYQITGVYFPNLPISIVGSITVSFKGQQYLGLPNNGIFNFDLSGAGFGGSPADYGLVTKSVVAGSATLFEIKDIHHEILVYGIELVPGVIKFLTILFTVPQADSSNDWEGQCLSSCDVPYGGELPLPNDDCGISIAEAEEACECAKDTVFFPLCVNDVIAFCDLAAAENFNVVVKGPEALVPPISKVCKMCYDTGYEQGQMDCEPDTTGVVTSDPHVSGFNKQRWVSCSPSLIANYGMAT